MWYGEKKEEVEKNNNIQQHWRREMNVIGRKRERKSEEIVNTYMRR